MPRELWSCIDITPFFRGTKGLVGDYVEGSERKAFFYRVALWGFQACSLFTVEPVWREIKRIEKGLHRYSGSLNPPASSL